MKILTASPHLDDGRRDNVALAASQERSLPVEERCMMGLPETWGDPVSGGSVGRTFDKDGYSKRLSRAFTGLDFNYESMEDELTCPVCLELYADPLMLPCSHSVCKKCLQDIHASTKLSTTKSGIECPSCRKVVQLDAVSALPRNLALENVVIRYSEERSKSIRKSLSLESPVSDLVSSPGSDSTDLPEFPTASRTECELCETRSPLTAAWFCAQCEVAYCHACFAKFHPRRGTLARHKVRPPLDDERAHKPAYCADHPTEGASIFCDRCKVLICSLCMCEDEGRHGGHKVLAPDTACKRIKEKALTSHEQTRLLVTTLREQHGKIETLQDELQDVHKDVCEHVQQQFQRLIDDVTAALTLERDLALAAMEASRTRSANPISAYLEASSACAVRLQSLTSDCEDLSEDRPLRETLTRAHQVEPLTSHLKETGQELDSLTCRYEQILKDRAGHVELTAATDTFRTNALRTVRALLGDQSEECTSIIPHIKSPTSPGQFDLAPRIQNKYLLTWGFSSTSFTGEPLAASSSWTVTIERNAGHWTNWAAGYLFGVGVAAAPLSVKDLVGMTASSHGVVCTGGAMRYAHGADQQHLLTVCALPISVTLTVRRHHPHYTVLSYKLAPPGQGTALTGHKVIADPALKDSIYPVFTLSQRVKLLFPTFV